MGLNPVQTSTAKGYTKTMNNDPLFEYLSSAEYLWEDRELNEHMARFDIDVWLETGRTDQFKRD